VPAEPDATPHRFDLMGVLHLLPLPGAPTPSPGLEAVEARAVADARTLVAGGIHTAIIENLGDAPFTGGRVGPETVAMMTRIAATVRREVPALHLGVNVLRNDALAALSIAAAVGARFVRVNVLSGASWTDQGLIEGRARDLLLLRRRLKHDGIPSIAIAADIRVKHGTPAGEADRVRLAHDTAGRGGADVLIVTGAATGAPTELSDIAAVRQAGGVPVWVGSGVTQGSIATVRRSADGAVVGTALHDNADIRAPLCQARVEAMVAAARLS